MRRLLFLGLVLVGLVRPAWAEWPALPPLAGELAGIFSMTELPGAPAISWKVAIIAGEGGRRRAELSADAKGTRLRLQADFDPATGDGTWRIEEGAIDAGAWAAALLPQLAPAMAGAAVEGNLLISGEGGLHQGRPAGRVVLEWRGGTVRDAAQGWALEGVGLHAEFDFDAAGSTWASSSPIELTVHTVTTARFGARNLFLRARLDQRLELAVEAARVELAGGEVSADPCSIPLVPPVVAVNVHINRIGLQDVVALVPSGLADARGRIDGEVRLNWSKADGIQVGAGRLALRDDEPAMVRLAAAPGFLTGHVPERFALLPAWTGALGRWLQPLNPAYADLQAIELGQSDLRVQSLAVTLTPAGDEHGRSAHVQISARPVQGGTAVDHVNFEVNVAGPLSDVFRLGLTDRVSMGLR